MTLDKLENKENISINYTRLSFLQTKEWSLINNLFNKSREIIISDDSKEIVGKFFIKDTTVFYKKIIKNILRIESGVMECHCGPVFSKDCSDVKINNFLDSLIFTVKKIKISNVLITTNSFDNGNLIYRFVKLSEKKGFKFFEQYNPIVDLRESENDILMSFKNSARTGARKAISKGVSVKVCKTFDEYMKVINLSSSVKNLEKKRLKDHRFFWDNNSSKYSYFYSELNGEIFSALGTYENEGVVTPISSCISKSGLESKIPVQDLLFREIIIYHKKKGNDFFELTPVIFDDNLMTKKEIGIRSFKLKWSRKFLKQYRLEMNVDDIKKI